MCALGRGDDGGCSAAPHGGRGGVLTSLRAGSPKTAHARMPMRTSSRSIVLSSPTRVGRRLCRQQSHGRLSSSPRAASESGARGTCQRGGRKRKGGTVNEGEGEGRRVSLDGGICLARAARAHV